MNANRIRGKIAESGMTQEGVARAAGMSGNSLSRKLTGKRDFKLAEVESLCRVLKIDDPGPYFFATNVPNVQQTRK